MATGALIGGTTTVSGTAAAGIGDGRVGHYPLNTVQPDGTVHDASPHDNDGLNDGAMVVRGGGTVGNAFAFDAAEADGVTIPDDESLDITGALTLAAWVAFDSRRYHSIIAKTIDNGALHNPYDFRTDNQTSQLVLIRADDDGYQTIRSTPGVLSMDGWQHVAVTVDTQGTATFYVDGTAAGGGIFSLTPTGNAQPARIGRRGDTVTPFDGRIDEARIYDRALSQDEIQSLAAMGGNIGGA